MKTLTIKQESLHEFAKKYLVDFREIKDGYSPEAKQLLNFSKPITVRKSILDALDDVEHYNEARVEFQITENMNMPLINRPFKLSLLYHFAEYDDLSYQLILMDWGISQISPL